MATKRKPVKRKSERGSTLYGVLAGLLIGLVVAAGVAFYVTQAPMPFVDRASRENDAFLGQYEASFGRHAPPLGSIAQSNYEGLRFLETVASSAGSLARKPLLSAAANVDYQGARGTVGVSGTRTFSPFMSSSPDTLRLLVVNCRGARSET